MPLSFLRWLPCSNPLMQGKPVGWTSRSSFQQPLVILLIYCLCNDCPRDQLQSGNGFPWNDLHLHVNKSEVVILSISTQLWSAAADTSVNVADCSLPVSSSQLNNAADITVCVERRRSPSVLGKEIGKHNSFYPATPLVKSSGENLTPVVCPAPSTRRSTIGGRAFPVATAWAWNSLPSSATTVWSLYAFRDDLKTVLFRASFDDRTAHIFTNNCHLWLLFSAPATVINCDSVTLNTFIHSSCSNRGRTVTSILAPL